MLLGGGGGDYGVTSGARLTLGPRVHCMLTAGLDPSPRTDSQSMLEKLQCVLLCPIIKFYGIKYILFELYNYDEKLMVEYSFPKSYTIIKT